MEPTGPPRRLTGPSYVTTGTAPLVGRRAELDWLARQLEAAASGDPRLVFVHGDAGIGKSRLADELGRRATAQGFVVAKGRCREDLALPYLPFAGSLFPLLEPVLREDPDFEDYAQFFQLLLGRAPAPAASPRDQHEQTRLFSVVTQAALRFARSRSVLLIVDDIQWIDTPSLELLRHLILEAADSSLREPVAFMVLCTHRPGLDLNLEAELARFRREECASELELHGLTEPEAVEFVRALGLNEPDRRLTAAVYEATRGNALFIAAIVHDLQRQGGPPPSVLGPAVPADLDQALAATLSRLIDGDRDVLTVAAIFGDRASFDDLVALRPVDAVMHAAGEGEALRVVARHGDGVRFTHPLYAHLLRTALAAPLRRRYHVSVAEAIATSDPEGARALEVARHLIEGGDEADPTRVLDAAPVGAEQAWALFAWGDAARCYEGAADVGTRLGVPDRDLAHLHLRAGTAYRRNLDDAAARIHLARAVDMFRSCDDARGLASALSEVAVVELTSGKFVVAVDIGELNALADRLEGEDAGLAGGLLAQIATWLMSVDRLDNAEQLSVRALDLALKASDDSSALQAQVALATLAWTNLDLHDARVRLEDAVARAGAVRDPWLANRARPRLALTLLWLGHLSEAEAMAQAACDEARRTADWATLTMALAGLLGVAAARGEQHRAEELGDEAWLALRLSHYRWGAGFALSALVSARVARGDLPGARDALARWRASGVTRDQDGSTEMLIDVADLVIQAHEHRPVELPAWVPSALARWPTRVGAVMVPAALAELAATGACSLPDGLLESALDRIAESGMLMTDGLLILVPRARGLAALAAGRLEDACARLAEAINVAKAIGAVTEEARARLDLARALARSGKVAAAAEQARSAAELAGALSMKVVASDANALAAELSRPAVALELPQSSATAVILFTDVVGSTALTERIGDAAYRSIADRLNAELRDIIDTCGGATIPGITLGDGLVALFGSASGALGFAARAHGCANGLELSLRVGVHAGDVIRAGEVVSGGAVNVAARICAAAEPSETLVSETVRSLARTSAGVTFDDRGEHDLKGVSAPHRLYSARPAAH